MSRHANYRRTNKKPHQLAMEKLPKYQVNYRRGFEDNAFCARCSMWREPASCTAVGGHIARTDLCDLFEPQ